MAKQFGLAITWLSLLMAAGCSGGMTEPAPIPKPSAETQAAPTVPTGPPPTPAPSPTPTPPPGPTPGPGTPPPQPPAPATDIYDAEVGTVFWHGEPLFGNRFSIEVWHARAEVWLHNTRLWIAQRDADSIIATDRDPGQGGGAHTLTATLNLKTKQWSFNGVAGSGGGTLTLKESR